MHKDKHRKSTFEKFEGADITNDMLQKAAQLFSEHYGVWSEDAAKMIGKQPGQSIHVNLFDIY